MTGTAVVLIVLLVIASSAVAFFGAIALWYLAVLIYDEIVLSFGKDAPPRMTRKERREQEEQWEAFLEDLRNDHFTQPINVFRDGYARV